jgi:hypothetical protein
MRRRGGRSGPSIGPHRSAPHPRWYGRGATRAGGDDGGAATGKAGDTGDVRGLEGLGEGHRLQDGGEQPGKHGRARPGRSKKGDAVSPCPWGLVALGAVGDIVAGLAWLLDCRGILKQLYQGQAEKRHDWVARQFVGSR